MHHGCPWEIAVNLDVEERKAFCIVFSEMEGDRVFDFRIGEWVKRNG